MRSTPHGLAGRVLFNVVYAALQAFIYALSAYITARLLSSALLRALARRVIAARNMLWTGVTIIAGAAFLPVARGVRRVMEIVRDARDQVLLDSLGGAVA